MAKETVAAALPTESEFLNIELPDDMDGAEDDQLGAGSLQGLAAVAKTRKVEGGSQVAEHATDQTRQRRVATPNRAFHQTGARGSGKAAGKGARAEEIRAIDREINRSMLALNNAVRPSSSTASTSAPALSRLRAHSS